MRKIFQTYKYDILSITILTTLFLISVSVLWSYLGFPIIDCGREAYIPLAMLKGKVLYKDIFNLYNPLSLQINAIILLIFGKHLNSLYLAGAINAYIVLLLVYLISRTISSKLISFSISFLTMSLCFFFIGIFNYIFPYSYAFPYALSALLISILLCIYYIKNDESSDSTKNKLLIYLSFFFLGVSTANKFEYTLTLIPLLLIVSCLKPMRSMQVIYAIYIFMIMPVISWGIVFYQGLTISEFLDYLIFGKKFFESVFLKIYYGSRFNFPLNIHISKSLVNFQTAASIFLSILVLVKLFIYIWDKYEPQKLKRIFIESLLLAFIIYYSRLQILNFVDITNFQIFCWMGISTLVISGLIIYDVIKHPPSFLTELQKDKAKSILLFLGITTILASLRIHLFVSIVYGTYLLPLMFIVNIIFIAKYFPKYLPFLKSYQWEKAACTAIIIISTQFLFINIGITRLNNTIALRTAKGTLHIANYLGNALSNTLNYINTYIPKNSSILMLPEGPLLNFLTDRPSNDMYYNLIPNHIDAFDEERIVKKLSVNPPDYIFINNRDSSEYGPKYFCKDYAFQICGFVYTNYSLIKEFSNKKDYNFLIKIYKLDPNYKKKYGLE